MSRKPINYSHKGSHQRKDHHRTPSLPMDQEPLNKMKNLFNRNYSLKMNNRLTTIIKRSSIHLEQMGILTIKSQFLGRAYLRRKWKFKSLKVRFLLVALLLIIRKIKMN